MARQNKKNISELPAEIAGRYPEMTLSQYRLLCFCAYCGSYPSTWTREKYDVTFGIRKGKTSSDYAALKKCGAIADDRIAPPLWFRIILPMMREHPEWEDTFRSLCQNQGSPQGYLWNVAQAITAGSLKAAAGIRYPERGETWRYFEPIVFNGNCGPVISLLPGRDRSSLLVHILDKAMLYDLLSEELIDKVKDAALSWVGDPAEIVDQADACRYFLSGVLPPEKERGELATMWSEAVRAISNLYRGNLSDALLAFNCARTLAPALDSRNSFRNPILSWFWAITLVRCCKGLHSHAAKTALEALQGDSTFKFGNLHSPARILLTYMNNTSRKCNGFVLSTLKSFQKEGAYTLTDHLGNIVAHYFRLDADALQELGYRNTPEPTMMILRNEASPFIPMTSSAKESLRETYGGPGTLAAVPRKEGWEMALSELTGQVMKNEEEKEAQKRIIYFLNDNWITAVMEQRKQPGEEDWGHDTLLSRNLLISAAYDSMDAVDIRLARALGNKVIDRPDLDVALPILAGTGRIFTGQHYNKPYKPLDVEEENPFVAFSGKDGGIAVSTNAGRDRDGTMKAATIIPRNGGYVCIRTNPVQRDILQNLMEVGHFPASAAPAIRNTIESLKGIIEVKSDLSSAALIPTMRGSTRLALRLSPNPEVKEEYLLDVQAAPNENGYLRCEPGQGAEDVYDDTGEQAVFIRRDLQQEYDNYMDFRDTAENTFNLEFTSSTRCIVCTTESLLNILVWSYDNRDRSFVEWPEGRPLRFRGDVLSSDIDITVNSGIEWFAVEGEVNIGRDKYNLKELLDAMRASDPGGYVKLGDKDYVRMSGILRKHLEALDEMMNGRRGKEKVVPFYRVGQLAEVLGEEGGLNATMDEGFKDLLRKMQDAYDSTPALPDGLNATMRDYQVEGYRWMKRLDAWGAGACLADDMGLGKTLQSLAFMLSKSGDGPSLVIAPKSVVPNWDMEAAKFTPSLNVKVLNSENSGRRADLISGAGPGDLVLATYGVLGTEADLLASREWNVICLDEAHQIKNRNTRVSAAAMGLQGRSRIILTGTPIQNHLGELWNLFQFINPGLLGQWTDFKGRYMMGTALDEENKSFLRDLVQPFILRRTKEEVLDELPEKMVYEQMVELSEEELQLYEATRKYVEDRIGKKKEKDKVEIAFFAELTKLRLAACSMSLVYDDWKGGSSKTDALKGIIDELSGNEGNRVLIFSQFTSYLAQVRLMLDKAGLRYLYLDGQTDLEERADLVTQFQNGDCPIFLVSLKAGGLGLNLTAANYVILLDPWWNPAIENQAMDRAHRIGQKRNVTVIRLIAKHTIEEKILRMHEAKQTLSDEMMEGTADSWHLSMDDILDMVSPFR